MMKKLTTLILSAAIIPAFALGTAAVAGDHNKIQEDAKVRDGVLENSENGEDRSGMHDADKQSTGMQGTAGTTQTADMQPRGEAQMSGKPTGAFYAEDVIGSNIKHSGSDEDVGEINDLIIDEDGRIVGVVVQTSSFLGLGGQEAALGWDHLEHSMEDGKSVFSTDIDEDSLRDSPKYERS